MELYVDLTFFGVVLALGVIESDVLHNDNECSNTLM